jgi:hypothetical protein
MTAACPLAGSNTMTALRRFFEAVPATTSELLRACSTSPTRIVTVRTRRPSIEPALCREQLPVHQSESPSRLLGMIGMR